MTQAWMSAAERIQGRAVTAPPGRGAPRAVWGVTESDPATRSAGEEARHLVERCRETHLVWNPLTGEIVQLLPATRRGRMELGAAQEYAQHLDHGLEGRVCLAVAVVARREAPFTDGPMRGLEPLLGWLDSWGVARRWNGTPPGAPEEPGTRDEARARAWSRGGHFGQDRVPGSEATGPGHVDPARLLDPYSRVERDTAADQARSAFEPATTSK
ncbi:hypothetical protein DFP74_6005 [Nocardiopsis sp. Huas11]|uniref:hypothetical protein n=1 Tax=Nocardiopsis sp. Huas11 TaxID=2183912 RepID=UPI000EB3FC89|nr:hypothetical protein [Nocardiopsis sp. Huas11]RKS10248.1 hypothetical protein DFP74_6005 [Nocardiopsis sp. Huas11]